MQNYEKLGAFYLGRYYDPNSKSLKEDIVLYDSKDLVTHAVCVGMTGSGKTGLCICLLEEAALDGVPSIVIDPKGDITNLLLTFPEMRKEDFIPWVNPEDAMKNDLSLEEYAAKQAETWKKGLASWGEDGERIKRLRETSNFMIYTPGSNAGLPVSILKSFSAPPAEIIEDDELLQGRVGTTVSSLLGLLGIDSDPIGSRDHILISTILTEAWSNGYNLDLASLIHQIQSPPIKNIGILDLESFYSSKDRFALAMKLNNLLAAPSFRLWFEGEPLEIKSFLFGSDGKPKTSIFSIAHLSEAERMFFVSLLLNHIVGWMRTQSGTTSLRAILYIDEVFGYLPPVSNPPSKLPLLTLMKQARAFGVGVTLVTQNPVDLDYKGLSNTGTWFIGRLQTERDKLRILDALEGVSAESGEKFDRQDMDRIIAGLGKRIFLMHNVHDDEPAVFSSRWAMSYLRGPLTRDQIKILMDPIKSSMSEGRSSIIPEESPLIKKVPLSARTQGSQRPVLPSDIPQYFIRMGGQQADIVYRPMILGISQVRFFDAKKGVDEIKELHFLTPITNDPIAVDWEMAEEVNITISDLTKVPSDHAEFSDLPSAASVPKNFTKWKKTFGDWLVGSQKIQLLRSPSLNQYSKVGETESDFRIRMQLAAREILDENIEKLRKKFAPKYAALDERIRKAEIALEKEKDQERYHRHQSAISLGSTLLDAVMGRKVKSSASRTVRDYERSRKEKMDIEFADENLESLQGQRKRLEEDFNAEVDKIRGRIDPLTENLETVSISTTKTKISIKLVALAWSPDIKSK
ncbi:MAG: ATP-binding protein [Methanomassiliicoccales archaeon]|nr:ATP-binding protein [Methanomassiliicoccales archaeon]NYT15791.1 ATP-binding protein [Methanomassiliicoccales archaeon]